MEIIFSIVVGGFLLVMALKFWRVTLVLGLVFVTVVAFMTFPSWRQSQAEIAAIRDGAWPSPDMVGDAPAPPTPVKAVPVAHRHHSRVSPDPDLETSDNAMWCQAGRCYRGNILKDPSTWQDTGPEPREAN